MSDSDAQVLNELFARAPNSSLEPDAMTELTSTMRLYSLSPQELFYKWESYSLKMGLEDQHLTYNTAKALKQAIQDGLERENRSKAAHKVEKRTTVNSRPAAAGGDVLGILDGLVPNNPRPGAARQNGLSARRAGHIETPSVRVKAELQGSPSAFPAVEQMQTSTAPIAPFADRANRGQVIEILNDHLDFPSGTETAFTETRIKLTAGSDIKKLSYKTMAMKLSEASEILDERIDDFMSFIQEHYSLDDAEFGNPASQNTSQIVAVGRIASDSLDGKLNASSLVLESSRRMGAGWRVPLNMKAVPSFQFFPGKIVAAKGVNVSGQEFVVSELLEIPLLPVAASPLDTLELHTQRLRGGPDAMDSDAEPLPLNIYLASGPYTADDNLDFEPLHELCSQAASNSADALILAGPFLDIDHPLIASGDFDVPNELSTDGSTFAAVFQHLISPIFRQLVISNPHITILLIPSVRDAITAHVSWPQEPFSRKPLGLPREVKMIGNPMIVSLNEIVFGVSSQDILTELKHAEVTSNKPKDSNPLVRLSKYLIEQRHFFPLFPPVERAALPKTGTDEGQATGAMLDPSYLKLGEIINTRPDIMFVPSALTPFAKVVDNVLVVNPGYLSKRRAPGTYARLKVQAPSSLFANTTSGNMVGHRLFERAKVEIVRI